MAKRTFMEIMTEISSVKDDYASIILRAYESKTPLYADADARTKLRGLLDRLDALQTLIAKLSECDDKEDARRLVAEMQNTISTSLEPSERRARQIYESK